MGNFTFNQPHFELHCINLPDDVLRIISFEGSEQLSGLYEYRFRLLSEDPGLNTQDVLNCNATFIINRGEDKSQKINGIISNFKQLGRTPDYVSYQAVLVPKMWRLLLNKQSRVFQTVNIEKMITQVLEDAGFRSSDYEFKLENSYPDIEFAVQYHETDFNFINRRLEHLGIFYFIDQRKENDVIVFCDSNDNVLSIGTSEDIYFNPNKDPLSVQETISELVHDESVVTGQVRLKDYNYEFPSKQMLVESQLDKTALGSHFNYGDNYKNESEGEFLARIRNEEILSKGSIFTGKSDCRLFRAGYKFQMGKHYRDEWNKEFLLTKVLSRGTQRGLFGILQPAQKIEPTYENIFEAIPQSLPFRPPRVALQPRIYGVMNARIDAAGDGKQAEIDEQGRYKIILPFDLSGNKDGKASCYVRMVQPYAGPDYGLHFPLHKGSEVLLTFLDGDPDRPVISGAVPNPETISPVTSKNQTKSIIRDHYGNEIIMDATPGNEHIRLYSPHNNSGFELGRSLIRWSQSDESNFTIGNSGEVVFGSKAEVVVGNALDLQIGTMWNLAEGMQFNHAWGGKFEVNQAFEIKNTKEPIIHSSKKDILSTSKQDLIMSAGDQVCIVGGAIKTQPGKKNKRSILGIHPDKISLSVGSKQTTRYLDAQRRMKPGAPKGDLYDKTPKTASVVAVLSTMMLGSIISTAFSELTEAASRESSDWNWLWGAGSSAGALNAMLASYLLANQLLRKEIVDSKIEPVEHEDPDAKIEMRDNGDINIRSYVKPPVDVPAARRGKITLSVGEENKEDAQIGLSKDPGSNQMGRINIKVGEKGEIVIQNDNASIKIKKDGEVEINSKKLTKIDSKKTNIKSDIIDIVSQKNLGLCSKSGSVYAKGAIKHKHWTCLA